MKRSFERSCIVTCPKLWAAIGSVMFMCCGERAHEAPFEGLDPHRKCEVFFLRSGATPSEFNSRSGSFRCSGPDQISKLKERWRFTTACEESACGFEYVVYTLNDGHPVEEFRINGPCGHVVTRNGWYRFDTVRYGDLDTKHLVRLDETQADSAMSALSALFGP